MVLKHVCKKYENGMTAVKDFDLEIKEGEFIILVGPSGCGKSTTLRMIAGLEEISSGEFWLDGNLVNFLEPQKRGLSMVFQNYALYPYMNIYDNMAFSLQIRKCPKAEIDRRVRETAELLGIVNLLDRRPSEVSGGQRQRVAIGSAIVRRPSVYLMDEPLSNLDAKLRAQMRVELAKLHKKLNATIIYVTHDQVEAMTLGTRIVVMNKGEIQQAAPPEELYRNPVNQFVAGFIGSPSMNFMDAMVISAGENVYMDVAGQRIRLPEDLSRTVLSKGYTKLRVGIRPEDLEPVTGDMAEGEKDCLSMDVQVRDLLGAEVQLHGITGRYKISVRTDADCMVQSGEKVMLKINFPHMLLFDPQTEENIMYQEKTEEKAV